MERVRRASEALACAFDSIFEKKPPKRSASAKAAEEALERFLVRVSEVTRDERLGLFGRALLTYRLQRLLIAKGYPPALVRRVLFAMLAHSFTGK